MVEPISIVGLTFGIIGLLSTIRNGVSTFHRDTREFREFDGKLIDLYNELETWEQRMQSWKAFWMVQEGESETLFTVFWGDENSIKVRLDRIKKTAEKISSLLASLDGNGGNNLRGKLEFVLIRSSQLRDLLTTLKNQVEQLNIFSIDLFREEHSVYGKPDRQMIEKARDEEIEGLLVNLVQATSASSTALYNSCNDVDQYRHDTQIIGLELDLLESEKFASWFANVENFATIRELRFYFLVRYEDSGPAWRVRIRPISNCSDAEGSESLIRELNKLHLQDGKSGFLTGADNLYFQLQGALEGEASYSNPLVAALMKVRQTNLIGSPAPLSEATRLDLVYSLVKCGLLLLETPWFSELCSCGIQQITLLEKTRYTFRVQPVEHLTVEPRSSGNHEPSRWCQLNIAGEQGQLFVLGIILIEVALGAPVFEIHHGRASISSLEISFESGIQNIEKAEVMIMVEEATGSGEYREVVDYCLRRRLHGPSGLDLGSFFQKALLPSVTPPCYLL
ncbi:MAG: hypothetical protein M1839_009287 [Geoglossum umbratile]|nr:MAG: hypothetical protein M1839_009287 [Geoglossum umbratile]